VLNLLPVAERNLPAAYKSTDAKIPKRVAEDPIAASALTEALKSALK